MGNEPYQVEFKLLRNKTQKKESSPQTHAYIFDGNLFVIISLAVQFVLQLRHEHLLVVSGVEKLPEHFHRLQQVWFRKKLWNVFSQQES